MPTPLPRPGPTDYQDAPGTELDLVWDELCDVVEATEATANAALPATQAAAGTLIAAAADKATPVDADSLALSDSAAGGILRRFSWASLKAALNGVFARLAGVAGGQTLIGGTASGENLTLRSTAHATRGAIIFGSASEYDEANNCLGIGTLTPAAKVHSLATTEQLRLGYDASNYYSITVASDGAVTHESTGAKSIFKSVASIASRGAELLSNPSFVSDLSGWADSGATWSWVSGGALHTAGASSNLSQNVTVSAGSTYLLTFTISGRTAGTIAIALGAVSAIQSGASTAFSASQSTTLVAGASGSVSLTITPTTTFDGRIDDISLKEVALGTADPAITLSEGAGQLTGLRVAGALDCVSIGKSCGRSLCTGTANSVVGSLAGYSLTCGYSNSFYGASAGYSCHNGLRNTFVGQTAGYLLTSGLDVTCIGVAAGRNLITSSQTVCVGASAGRYIANGSTALTEASNSVYCGQNSKASADAVTNENVFGYNATGIGSNSCVLGSSAVTKCQIFGDIILDKTVTAGGTTGAQTIHKTGGSVNFAAGATSLVITNNRVTTSSIIVATVATNDTTMKSVVAVAASGSFTLTANAAATAETRVNWLVIN